MDFLGWVRQVFWEKMWAEEKKEVKLVCLECIRRQANCEPDMVLKQWVPQKVKVFELEASVKYATEGSWGNFQ